MTKFVLSLFVLCSLVLSINHTIAQNVAITDDGGYSANASAMLDVKSTTKGMLVPRLTTIQRNAITTPAAGLLVFDTNQNNFYFFNGSAWSNLTSGNAGGIWSFSSNNVYTTSTGYNVGVGTSSPLSKLHIMDTVSVTDGTNGSFLNIQNYNSSNGIMSGIRFKNATGNDSFKGGIFYQRSLSNGRGDMLFVNNSEIGQTNATTMDARMVIKNDGKVEVKGSNTAGVDEAIFQVLNDNGDTIFAVYPQGVRINVADDTSAVKAGSSKGGFAVGGFSISKGTTNEYLRVTPDSVRVYVEESPVNKGTSSKGGFAVGGFSISKGTTNEFLRVTSDSTRIYVSDSTSGFGIASIEGGPTKSFLNMTTENYLIGHLSGNSITTGHYNAFLGYKSGYSTSTGEWNIFIGHLSGYSNTTGNKNVFIGDESGYSNIDGRRNIFIGHQSGYNNIGGANEDGDYNCFIGYQSGYSNTTGNYNSFYGYQAGYKNVSGNNNTFIGQASGWSDTSGFANTYIGLNSGFSNTSGSGNTFLGNGSGLLSQGSNNVFVGRWAGRGNIVGDSCVFIGHSAGENENNSHRLYIENSNAGKNIALIYGEFDNNLLYLNAEVRINNEYMLPSVDGTNLQVLQTDGSGITSWASISQESTSASNGLYMDSGGAIKMGGQLSESTTITQDNSNMTFDLTGTGNFRVLDEGNATFVVKSNGNVGIGNLNPDELFHIYGIDTTTLGASGVGLKLQNDIGTDGSMTSMTFEVGAAAPKAGIFFQRNETYGRGDIIFATDNSADNTEISTDDARMVITRIGRLGLGTTTPEAKFHSSGSATNNFIGVFTNTGNTVNSSCVKLQGGKTDASGINYLMGCYDGDGDFEGGLVVNNGNLELVQNSDMRLKENISNSGLNALAIINNLRVVDFNFIEGNKTTHTGYIAQEAAKVYPELVSYNKDADTWGMSMTKLIPVMNKAMQMQQEQLESLKKENEIQKDIINNLSQKLYEIDKMKEENATLKEEIESVAAYKNR